MKDDDALVIPDGWTRGAAPRRGGTIAPGKVRIDGRAPAAVREFMAGIPDDLAALGLDPDGTSDPADAAAVAALAPPRQPPPFLDAWITEHGPAYAACALVRQKSVEVHRGEDGAATGIGIDPRAMYGPWHDPSYRDAARRLRTLLATLPDGEHQEVVDALEASGPRDGELLVAGYLVPSRHDWVLASCQDVPSGTNDQHLRQFLLPSLETAEQVAALGPAARLVRRELVSGMLATLLDGLGPAVLPLLTNTLHGSYMTADDARWAYEGLAVLPGDAAMEQLIERADRREVRTALLAAMKRFPVRAMRLLQAAGGPRDVLDWHARVHPETAAAVLSTAPERPAAPPMADPASLPGLLVEPPWTQGREAPEPVVIGGLEPAVPPSMAWAPGERDAWAATRTPPRAGRPLPADFDWERTAEEFRSGGRRGYNVTRFLADGPDAVVRPLLPLWRGYSFDAEDLPWTRSLVARYGWDAYPYALHVAGLRLGTGAELLLPYLTRAAAESMALWFGDRKGRRTALAWFGRHGIDGARLLVPAALAEPGKERRRAEDALRSVASSTGADPIVKAVRDDHGDRAADAIEALLSTDPLDLFPGQVRTEFPWVEPAALPPLLLRGRGEALPEAAVRHVLTMFAMSWLGDVYAGVETVRELCDPGSLAVFGRELFRHWRMWDCPSKDGWALAQLAWTGDDDTVRDLAPVIRAWPGEGGHTKAVQGLDVLTEIGTDVALMQLHGIAQRVKFKGLKAKAQEKIAEVAEKLELAPEQLADRLVPDFGLELDGTLTLDYGPRRFVVGFDEQLRPFVTDEDGKARKALPKPGAKDDADLAPAAHKRFTALKKDVRTVAADQIRRLEAAMVHGRRWTAAEFQEHLVAHPLVRHIARRLVWVAEEDGTATTFRVAEDRTLEDARDEALTLSGDALIGIPHPLRLGEDAAAWSEVFADYEIMQPFAQLSRPVHVPGEDERGAHRLARFENLTVPIGNVLGLERRGWQRGGAMDAGVAEGVHRQAGPGMHVSIWLDPGISLEQPTEFPEQTVLSVTLGTDPFDGGDTALRLGDADPVLLSELLGDLESLRTGS